ncbi:MAG: hypothetical protein HQL79_07360 [Magnetococcales bacterium]|nr:hypothetical protein [Magnetococcales bacterium]
MNDTRLSPMENRLVSLLQDGREPALSDFGGLQVFQQNMVEISLSPLLPEFIRLLLVSGISVGKDRESILELSIRLLVHVTDLGMDEVVNVILSSISLSDSWGKRFFHALLQISFEQDRDPLCRSFALDGAFRLVGEHISRRHALLAKLTEVETDDDPIFLRHVAKIIGISFTWWQSEGLTDRLQAIIEIEGADDEAIFELGMATLLEGLEATGVETVTAKLKEAQQWFKLAQEKRAHRPDAVLYIMAIQSWLDFSQGSTPENPSAFVIEINQEIFALQAWHHSQDAPIWLGARFAEYASWHLFGERLVNLAKRLRKPSWLDARLVIEHELIGIIISCRAIRKTTQDGGLELLALPRIVSGLNGNPGLIQHLQEWLQVTPEHPQANVVKALLADVDGAQPSNDEAESGIVRETWIKLVETLAGPSLTHSECQILECCVKILNAVEDYSNQDAKSAFNTILLLTFRYLISRMDLSIKNAPRLTFLQKSVRKSALPTEDKLQQDYYNYLIGFYPSGSIQIEQTDISSGRADLTVNSLGYRIVIEVKRELSDASFEHLKKAYISQTTEYQNTGIRLGILLVLDLTDKPNGVAHVTEQVKAVVIQRENEQSKRGVVIVRVPGNKHYPSAL